MKLYLLRHAESLANEKGLISCKLPGFGLSRNGTEQARSVGKQFNNIKKVRKIYCSPFRRTIETLKYADFFGEFIIEERIKELDYGDFDCRPVSEVEVEIVKTMEKIYQGDNEIRFGLTGENQKEFISRIYDFLAEVIKNDEPAAAVTHESVISVIHRLYRKMRRCEEKIKAENAKIIKLEFWPNDLSIIQTELQDYNN